MKTLTLLAFLFCLTISAMAQMPMGQMPSREEMNKMRLENMTQQLTLTEEQQASVKAIFEEEKMPEFTPGQQPDFSAFRKAMEETDAKIMKVLTEEQQKKYKEMQEQRRQMMGGGPR
ncbi:MAG: hypothetical protein HUJ96_11115 [Marinilabiliaceae bacterium]|nr:hypothetical protein [Marinilabiliaceae bacterium]